MEEGADLQTGEEEGAGWGLGGGEEEERKRKTRQGTIICINAVQCKGEHYCESGLSLTLHECLTK